MIVKIRSYEIRHYSDNRQTVAYCEWTDDRGRQGRTEGNVPARSPHMQELLWRALDEGVQPKFTNW